MAHDNVLKKGFVPGVGDVAEWVACRLLKKKRNEEAEEKRIQAQLQFARTILRRLPLHYNLRKRGAHVVRRLSSDVYKIPKLSNIQCSTYDSERRAALSRRRVE